MNLKIFLTVCVSCFFISFPQNIIGCGPDADPYDYYTSFFHQNLPDAKGYRPFYYTGYNFLYDEAEPVSTSDVLAKEWAGYCGSPVTTPDAKSFVTQFAWKDLNNLYFNLEKNQPLKIPDSVNRNSMTRYFLKNKSLEALGYIMFAKKTEQFTVGNAENWEAPEKDSIKMDKLIKNGFQLLSVTKQDFIQLRYIYQVMRLAHYSGRYNDVINWYDKYAVSNTDNTSVLKNLCLSLKAGALFRKGNNREAAYQFSKAFAATEVKRISNFLGFGWSIKHGEDRNIYLALCKTDAEKASMLALFAMSSTASETRTMKEIFRLNNAANDELEVLATREINKLEEKYLTPLLEKEKGGKAIYFSWGETTTDSAFTDNNRQAVELMRLLHELGGKGTLKNAGLFETGAAYTAYMLKDYATAKNYLASAQKMTLTQKQKDQWVLTNLLVTINEKEKIDAAFEEQLLPSIQWLEEKAKTEKAIVTKNAEISQWSLFYRNLLSQVLAIRYHQQGDFVKEALCVGTAYHILKDVVEFSYWEGDAVDFLRKKLESKDVEKLYTLMTSKNPSAFEHYLITHNTIKNTNVIDFAGTAYLRENDYANAIAWFKKSNEKKIIDKNPFIDLLYDQESSLVSEKGSTTKIAFATEMARLQKAAVTDKINAAKLYYKYALGLYNTTYYGHTWELVQYYRSGSDGYYMPANANSFQKEYYGCYKALEYFEKAMNASSDQNFKARCLFMMARCSQKQLRMPQYEDYAFDYEKMTPAENKYAMDFKNNKYFPKFIKEYSGTPFYKEAVTSCSYLRDFIKRK